MTKTAIVQRLAELYYRGALVGLPDEVQMLGMRAAQSLSTSQRDGIIQQSLSARRTQ